MTSKGKRKPAPDPAEAKEVADRLYNHLVQLDTHWRDYQYLYGDSKERLDRLNQTAKWFFGSLQRLLVRDIILSISRLTDPKGGGSRSNLVLEKLLDDALLDGKGSLRDELRDELEQIRVLASPIRDHRNKAVAHLDLAVAMENKRLPQLPRRTVDEVIARMQGVHGRHHLELYGSDLHYELQPLGSVEVLVRALDDAAKWREHERLERYRRYGVAPPEERGPQDAG
jgi:hypothetical protein